MRSVFRLLLALVLALGCVTFTFLLPAAGAGAAALPGQVVTVQSTSSSATTAKVDLWTRSGSGVYLHVGGPMPAYVGELGIGTTREGIARTPAGIFGLTQAFGNGANPGTKLPWFQAGPADWWDGQSGTAAYNTHVHQSASPGSASENLYSAGNVYSRAVVIDYNRFPAVAGKGSAFFLHVTNGQPTAGCVAMLAKHIDGIMRWLNPALHPAISIGVGSQATWLVNSVNATMATYNPIGHLDSVTALGGGKVRVVGWTADPDNLSAALIVRMYADSKANGVYATGVVRPDVARVKHTGPKPGFGSVVTVATGRHTICVHAVNIGRGTDYPSLGCIAVTVR